MSFKNSVDVVRIPNAGGEDYDEIYGERMRTMTTGSVPSFNGKRILDIGADVGSTADWFLRRGATEVIAIERPDSDYYLTLVENAKIIKGIVAIGLFINCPKHFEDLIWEHKPDVVKCDCECCEEHLMPINDDVFASVPEYIIELHNNELLASFIKKVARVKFQIIHIRSFGGNWYIVYARNPNLTYAG